MSTNFFKCDVNVDGEYFDTVILSSDYSEIDYIVEHVKNKAFNRSDRVEFELSDAVEDRFEITSERSLEICNLSDEDLCREINDSSEWDYDLLRDLVWRAGIYCPQIWNSFCATCEADKHGFSVADDEFMNICRQAAEFLDLNVEF